MNAIKQLEQRVIPAWAVCSLRGHDPVIVMRSSNPIIAGRSHYLTECRRCGNVYEQKVERV